MTTLRSVRRGVHALATEPRTFDLLRWILAAGYRGEKDVLRREGIAEAASILDLGCGTGAVARSFRPESYVGVDPNARYIARARSTKSRYRFEVADGRSLPFADGSFERFEDSVSRLKALLQLEFERFAEPQLSH